MLAAVRRKNASTPTASPHGFELSVDPTKSRSAPRLPDKCRRDHGPPRHRRPRYSARVSRAGEAALDAPTRPPGHPGASDRCAREWFGPTPAAPPRAPCAPSAKDRCCKVASGRPDRLQRPPRTAEELRHGLRCIGRIQQCEQARILRLSQLGRVKAGGNRVVSTPETGLS